MSFLCCSLLIWSCGDSSGFMKPGKIANATIEYEIKFPYIEEDDMISTFLPDKMTLHLKGDEYSTKIKTIGGVFKTSEIVNAKDKKYQQSLKLFTKKLTCDFDNDDMRIFKKDFPNFTLIPSSETATIAGVECKKMIGVFHDIQTPDFAVYYTDQFEIENPNFCNPFSEVKGLLMAYEIEQFDTRARITASNVTFDQVDEGEIAVDTDYQTVDYEVIRIELQKMMESFSI